MALADEDKLGLKPFSNPLVHKSIAKHKSAVEYRSAAEYKFTA